jgi:hypothetical protein
MDEQLAAYADEAFKSGVTDARGQAMCVNFRHQGGQGAVTRILAKTQKPYALDNLYAACQTDTGNQVGVYKDRQRFIYNALKTYFPESEDKSMNAIDKLIQIAKNETGRRTPTDAVIQLICEKCSVNEEWLRNGTGEPFQPENKNDEISKLFGNVLKSSDDDFKYRLINALAKLDDSGWDNLEKLLDTIYEKK